MPEPAEGAEVEKLNTIANLANRSPLVAVIALFVVGGGAGTIGSMYVAPLVDEGLAAHEANDRAHNVDRLEERLTALEAKIDKQGGDLADVKGTLDAAVRLLEAR